MTLGHGDRASQERGDTGNSPLHRVAPSPRLTWLTNPWLHIALIVLVAGFFRLWQLGAIPPGLFGDEATDGLDALDILAGRGAVFFPANFGREGLHMWIVAGMFRLLGVTPLALRLPSAIAGILTAGATYWLGRELGKSGNWGIGKLGRRDLSTSTPVSRSTDLPIYQSMIPLLAALYLATSYWHVHFSRFGIRGVFTPLCGALAFAAFWHAVNVPTAQRSNGPTLLWFALSGFFLGLATHFYTASRFFPFFLGGFLVLQALVAYATGRREEAILVRQFRGIVVLVAVAALVFLPLGIYFIQHPGSFAQRASEVAVTGEANPLGRMAQAAVANVLQFFAPGRGDPARFYNLPKRAVFDALTALLALIGIGALAWRWKRPAALFLLTWFPALLLPSFLATDRFPTLPRVLGVIPGVYFFPAIGLLTVAGLLRRRGDAATRGRGVYRLPSLPPLLRSSAPPLLCALALVVHASFTYHDYFRVWGPAAATFDAFEGDMTAAWRWLANNTPSGHVYLSSDIYRHPTFMLLGEQATVQTYFEHRNPDLSWYDARAALPLPPPGSHATYLIGASAAPPGPAAEWLAANGRERDRVLDPDGAPALTIIESAPAAAGLAGEAWFGQQALSVRFSDQLTLTAAAWRTGSDGAAELWLRWQTAGPDMAEWPGYRLEIAANDQVSTAPFDSYRPTEWVSGGSFITWHRTELAERPERLRLRLLRVANGQPVTRPDAADGWHAVAAR